MVNYWQIWTSAAPVGGLGRKIQSCSLSPYVVYDSETNILEMAKVFSWVSSVNLHTSATVYI